MNKQEFRQIYREYKPKIKFARAVFLVCQGDGFNPDNPAENRANREFWEVLHEYANKIGVSPIKAYKTLNL